MQQAALPILKLEIRNSKQFQMIKKQKLPNKAVSVVDIRILFIRDGSLTCESGSYENAAHLTLVGKRHRKNRCLVVSGAVGASFVCVQIRGFSLRIGSDLVCCARIQLPGGS